LPSACPVARSALTRIVAASQPTSIRVIRDLVGNGGLTLGVGAGAGQGGGAIYLVSLNSCGCEVERVCSPASPNSGSTAGSRIELVSSASLSLDALDLVATQPPVNQFALSFYGTGSTLVPFGHGVLCATPPFVRLPPPIQ
jgi:hypothetical protein